jgi:DNA helicase-2/ATP-dependent DNA helicase PcrA
MDFDDLLLNFFGLLEQYPEILNLYQAQFRHVLVDEFQDTNRVQYRIVRLLSAMHRNICLVGDDAQSIYAFRGAVIDNILNVHRDYPELQTFRLEQNYRSTGTIVGASGSIISHNSQQIPKNLWTQNPSGDLIRLMRCVSDNEEGRQIATELHAAKHQYRLNNKDFAILYRTNAQSRAFEEALRKQNIPYKVIGGMSFYQRKEVKDFLAYLRLVVNHADEEALRRVINYPARGIGRTSMDKWILEANHMGYSLWQMLVAMEQGHPLGRNLGAAGRKMADFARSVQVWAVTAQRENAIALARQVWKQSGLHAELRSDTTIEGVNRLQNVEELLNAIEEFCESDEAIPNEATGADDRSIGAFLQHIALLTSADETGDDGDRDYVSMMTVHQAKGLEFEHVFVVGLEEDLFPSAIARDSRSDLEEERRLFYVAITRARRRLLLSFALTRFRFGNLCYGEPSRFLFEMDPKFLEQPSLLRTGLPVLDNGSAMPGGSVWGADPARSLGQKSKGTHYPSARSHSKTGQGSGPPRFPGSVAAGKSAPKSPTEAIGPGDAPASFNVGDRVEHFRFGTGRIELLEGRFPDTKATIIFERHGTKQILLKFARLTKISG